MVAGGVEEAASGLAASCFAQAVSISAATSALRASLVFIDRYPKEKQEWYEKHFERVLSFRESLRIAGPKFYRVYRRFETAEPNCLPFTTSNMASGLKGAEEAKMSDVGSHAVLESSLNSTFETSKPLDPPSKLVISNSSRVSAAMS